MGRTLRCSNPADDGADFRQAHGLDDKFVALYAGAHGMSNDLDVVLDAAKIIQSTTISAKELRTLSRQIQIVLLGDGKEKAALQRRASEMGLANLIFLPSVPKNEMSLCLPGQTHASPF